MSFSVEKTSGRARAGTLRLAHGIVQTPVFMPVGTLGTVKAVLPSELEALGAEIILGNAYHLWLRPGLDVIRAHGGLHRFMRWWRPILTDSGGYQVFSLRAIAKITDEGVHFRSHIDGAPLLLTPEVSMEIQAALGSDIAMAFDHCPPADGAREEIEEALLRTTRWAARCIAAPKAEGQLRFGIVQGGTVVELRRRHLAEISALPFDGIALGGLAVGESPEVTYRVLDAVADEMPRDRARYLMGVGTPRDLAEAFGSGIDMCDCVLPTRNARNGQIFSWASENGKLMIGNARYKEDLTAIDPECACATCGKGFTRSYLAHLFRAGEILYSRLATVHNLHFYLDFARRARQAILADRYADFASAVRRRF